MTKESLERLLVDYGVSFTSALADRLLQECNPELCTDAISRQAAIEEMQEKHDDCAKTSVYTRLGFETAINIVKSLPPVKPQLKTGYWIEHPEIKTSAPEYLMFYECSECGYKQCFCKPDIHEKHFCINCGARMVEP